MRQFIRQFRVVYIPSVGKPDRIVEACDVSAVSDYTVQFYNRDGDTIRIIGGVAEVERIEPEEAKTPVDFTSSESSAPAQAEELTIVNTSGTPAPEPT